MIEGEADFVSEAQMKEAMYLANEAVKNSVTRRSSWRKRPAAPKRNISSIRFRKP